MTTFPEDRVLQTLDPIPDDVNDWPDFTLREVKIFYQGKGRYADLLEASDATPVCVLGELLPLEDEQQDLGKQTFNFCQSHVIADFAFSALLENVDYVRIKIENVTNYSFGQDDSGKPVIWAAGKAGWYEISSSDRYQQHYNDTIEAIDLFYFIVDQHQKLSPKRQRLGFQIDPFLTAYQKHTDYRIDDDDEAMEMIHKHHKFILRQMLEEREGIDWSQTHLWTHLTEVYSEELEEIRATSMLLNNPVIIAQEDDTEDSESSSGEESWEDADDENPPESATDEDDDDANDEEEEGKPDLSRDWTQAIWNLLNVLRKSPNFDMRSCGIDELATQVQKLPDFPQTDSSHSIALRTVEHHTDRLLRLMNEAKLRKKFNWSTRRIYQELEATLADEIADTTVQTPGKKPDKRHRQKSVLRPSGAGKARKRTRRLIDGGASLIEDSDAAEDSEAPHLNTHHNVSSSPVTQRRGAHTTTGAHLPQRSRNYHREMTIGDSGDEDSPSRQLNGHMNHNQPQHQHGRGGGLTNGHVRSNSVNMIDTLPSLSPGPEAQELLELVAKEAKMVGRQHQTGHLSAFLGQWVL